MLRYIYKKKGQKRSYITEPRKEEILSLNLLKLFLFPQSKRINRNESGTGPGPVWDLRGRDRVRIRVTTGVTVVEASLV